MSETINFSKNKREKLQAMDERKIKSDNFKAVLENLSEQTKNDLMDACLFAETLINLTLANKYPISLKEKERLNNQASKFNELYKKLQ